jgi:hypothetical protein
MLTQDSENVSTISSLTTDASVDFTTLGSFASLLVKLPDLLVYRPETRAQDMYVCSKAVNTFVDNITFVESKDERQNRTYTYAWMWTVVDNIYVYSNPPYYIIGRDNADGFGMTPTDGLDAELDKDEIASKLVRQVRQYIKDHPAISYM